MPLASIQTQVVLNVPHAMLEKPEHRARLVLLVNSVKAKTQMVQLPIRPLAMHVQPVIRLWKEVPNVRHVRQAGIVIVLVQMFVKSAWRDIIVNRGQHN